MRLSLSVRNVIAGAFAGYFFSDTSFTTFTPANLAIAAQNCKKIDVEGVGDTALLKGGLKRGLTIRFKQFSRIM